MNARRFNLIYLVAGAISGIVWFGVALGLDSGWAIPTDQFLPLLAAILCASITGVSISLIFRRAFRRLASGFFVFMPLITLPLAVVTFALLIWIARRLFDIEPALSLESIVATFVVGALLSIYTPFLLALSLVNQCVMRSLLRRCVGISISEAA